MATLTITVNDALVPRIAAAYGVANNQLKAAIIADVKTKVIAYELEAAREDGNEQIRAAVEAQRQAEATALANAESQITLS